MTETSPAPTAVTKEPFANGHVKTTAMARSSGAVFLSTIAGRILNFAAQVLLSNALGLSNFGAFMLGQSVLSFLTAFSQAGLHQATARYLAMGRAQQRAEIVRGVMRFAARRVVFVSAALGLALMALREPIAVLIFQKPEVAPVLLWVGLVLPFLSGLTWLGFALRGFRAVTAEALIKEIAQPAVFLVVCLCAFAIRTPSLTATWWAFLISTITAVLYGSARIYRSLKTVPRVAPDLAVGKDMRRFALPIWCNRLLVAVMNQGDRLIIGAFSQIAQVGLYHAAYRIAAFQTMAMGSFVPMFSIAIAEAHARDDRDAIIHHYRTAVRWSIMVTLPICLMCVLFGREILLFFGKEFESAVPILMLVTAASFVDAAVGPAGQFLQMIGRERAGLALVLVATIIAVGLNLILIPKWGAVGAACGTGTGVIVLNLSRLITLRHFLGVFPYTWLAAKLVLISLTAGTLAWLATPLGMIVKALVLIGALLAGITMWGLEQEDRALLQKLKKRVVRGH
jgi:O-antigen/teichoic acid export membrane protein